MTLQEYKKLLEAELKEIEKLQKQKNSGVLQTNPLWLLKEQGVDINFLICVGGRYMPLLQYLKDCSYKEKFLWG
ncbi:MAG: hypothetical protein PUB96_08790 [Helicobacteraceae bacterium]|nr:hypothetical protein [Helicobacteraceae bacterium]